ncbi:putative ester cyclase [Rhizobium sp. ERR 922]|uniref:ester cyclase n=1 Tax=unclassified Rhizobium TaxID=2613769 RepID=UPI0011A5F2DB|nr:MULTISPECIES: ester cyclase [unclassified Rhizobium]TWB46193.1 putative ester cyclase [Rhizobium sp. ERR 922]TWB90775.1 putative ester cyclase [Rhizobium sp. ERR 942]
MIKNAVTGGLAAAALAISVSAPAFAAAPLKIDDIVHSAKRSHAEASAETAARHFYSFWNTGDEADLKAAISPSFTDHTLPDGRPQGPEGPAFASKTFRAAVPDLSVEVRKMIFSGNYVTVHMVFRGHFTGTFASAKGTGQTIEFIATDLLKVTDGKVTDNWHIEDNLTLLKQIGVVSMK